MTFKTTWSLDELNISSALRKNVDGICAMNKCDNKLSNPPSCGYGGLKICNECRKPIDDALKNMITDADEYYIQKINDILIKKDKL